MEFLEVARNEVSTNTNLNTNHWRRWLSAKLAGCTLNYITASKGAAQTVAELELFIFIPISDGP